MPDFMNRLRELLRHHGANQDKRRTSPEDLRESFSRLTKPWELRGATEPTYAAHTLSREFGVPIATIEYIRLDDLWDSDTLKHAESRLAETAWDSIDHLCSRATQPLHHDFGTFAGEVAETYGQVLGDTFPLLGSRTICGQTLTELATVSYGRLLELYLRRRLGKPGAQTKPSPSILALSMLHIAEDCILLGHTSDQPAVMLAIKE